jgi:hypothetical protein
VFKVDECFGPPQVLPQVVPSLLGLNLVPPSVERLVNDRPASVIWWIDDFAMNELDRRRTGSILPIRRDGTGKYKRYGCSTNSSRTPTATYTRSNCDALEVRRALLVRHVDRLIGTRGEAVVLYDLPPR